MAEQQAPSKSDIQLILKRLRSHGPNKVCFDCNAKNPTWATVTYGVFICIDCSAVHRSLGVHLTFVRSTQLDTNWTWLQLRQMQLGGNANAQTFFLQHNCTTSDAHQKYNSRAAQLYREKLRNAAIQAMRDHGTKLHLDGGHEVHSEESKKETDFFEEHEKFDINLGETTMATAQPATHPSVSVANGAALSSAQPSVLSIGSELDSERKPTIGNRKPIAKKSGLGAKKTGLGAQRVKTNFSEIEQKAAIADQMKETAAQEAKLQAERTAEEQEKQLASIQLAYQDLSIQQKKEEDKLRTLDPKKATQVERLGMGFASRSGVSHSATNDMQTIEQDAPAKPPSSLTLGKSLFDRDDFDGFQIISDVYSSLKYEMDNSARDREREKERESDSMAYNFKIEERDREREREKERERERERERDRERESEKDRYRSGPSNWERSRTSSKSSESTPSGNEAQKKFGGAKAISSDQFFADSDNTSWERKANLSRFEGSTSISSADYFGNGSSNARSSSGYGSQITTPDLEDVKESVRQGVTKVAGKLSSLANGVMSSLQERYGY